MPSATIVFTRFFFEISSYSVDINQEWIVTRDDFASKSHNSAFIGKKLKGKVVATIAKGTYYSADK